MDASKALSELDTSAMRISRPGLPVSVDVHSFHVDTANVPTETMLCTYPGDASEVLPRADALRRVDEPALRARLRQRFVASGAARILTPGDTSPSGGGQAHDDSPPPSFLWLEQAFASEDFRR
jgi:hypothetical protein